MKIIISIASLILAVFIILFFTILMKATGVPENNIENTIKFHKANKPIVLFLGDSITHGRVSFDYVNYIQNYSDSQMYSIVNEGINSRLTYQIIDLLGTVEILSPSIVFILVGTNDLKATINEKEFNSYKNKWALKEQPTIISFKNNYLTIVRKLKKIKNIKICLISIPNLGESLNSKPLLASMEYSKHIKEISEIEKIDYLPFNELLIEKLKGSGKTDLKEYITNPIEMYTSILKYYLMLKSWDNISEENNYLYLTDGIHLNDKAGKILNSLVLAQLDKYSAKNTSKTNN